MTRFSIVVPTLNESENIDFLISQIHALDLTLANYEIIFVDDNSSDGTQEKIRAWQSRSNVQLIERKEKPDLTASILAGAAAAQNDVVVVMDADLSHPPEKIIDLVTPVLNGKSDITIGSRYVPGGKTENWPWYRRWLSQIGGWLARPISDVNDGTSGFFAFRKELINTIADNAQGYKILLELLMANHGQIKVTEIPISFRDRTLGTSKLSFSHQWTYLQRLMALAGGMVTLNTASRFALVGFLGVFIDAFVFHSMVSSGAGLALAHFVSFFVAASVNYTLNSKWAFRQHHTGYLHWHQFGRFLTVGAFALLLRGGVLALLVYAWDVPAILAIFPAIVMTALVNYLGSAFYVFPSEKDLPSIDIRWRVASIGVVLFIILLRLVYFGHAQLIPDEAYYWNYAQRMDLSFFDHPPMVAWLIWLGTSIAGNNEFGVRLGAFICGLIAMGYLYALAQNLYDKSTAMRSVLLLSVLPLGFASTLLMTPDAPLIATWAATLYYMERALIAQRSWAWLGLGIAFGLGILSKYTLGLLGVTILVFMLLDPTARRWFKRPHPYLATLLALVLFSPVVVWNIQNDWASFAFQSNRILWDGYEFSTHHLILHMAILLTPIGMIAAWLAFFSPMGHHENKQFEKKRRLFVRVIAGIPFLVFLIVSTFDQPRFHWSIPMWLAILPTMAWMMGQTTQIRSMAHRVCQYWRPTIVACTFIYAFVLHYIVLGIPGIPYQIFTEHYYWREAAAEIEQIADEVQQETGKKPIVVGMSKWSVASALYFYNKSGNNMDIRSRNMFGDSGAMYDFWFPSQEPTTRPIIQVGMKRTHLEHNRAGEKFDPMLDQPGDIQYRVIERHDTPVRRVYYRIALGFLGLSDQSALQMTQSTPEK